MTSDPIPRLNAALEGRYRIERELGEGGMATVYLADDLRHERRVALKVLKPELAAVVGAERFLTEIKTTANLQHPHILPLFDSGEADGFLFYVMPYVEGESLRARLDRERELPVDEAVRIASDVAEALQAAHDQGVIHRDIKPANILLSKGRPLVSDFGIALAVTAAGGGRLTETGLSMGTPFYMSPEQASADREPTAASDVYSLGCVLYEMLVGDPPYVAGSAQAVLAKILTDEPPEPRRARPSIPTNVDAAIRRALEKLPADRFASARDFAQALAQPGFGHGKAAATTSNSALNRWRLAAVALGATAALLAGLLMTQGSADPVGVDAPEVAFHATLSGFDVRSEVNTGVRVALSRDASQVAVASYLDGVSRIFVRRSDQRDFREIPGTQGAQNPEFSPDGEWLAFARPVEGGLGTAGRSEILRVEIATGTVMRVAPGGAPHWAFPDTIVFEGVDGEVDGIFHVSPRGGDPTLIIPWPVANSWPHMLPDGQSVLFQSDTRAGRSIHLADVRTGEVRDLEILGHNPRYVVSGHLLFSAQDQTLSAVAFDLDTRRAVGTPSMVLPRVLVYGGGATQLAVSQSGLALYGLPGPSGLVDRELIVADATGGVRALPLGVGAYSIPRFSPDGTTISYERGSAVWTYDLATGRTVALSSEAAWFPSDWSADGQHVYYSRLGQPGIFRARSDGSGGSEHLYENAASGGHYLLSVGPVGGLSLIGRTTSESGWDLLTLSGDRDGATLADYLTAPWNEFMGAISPDGAWVAYASDETGAVEVFVRSFPNAGSAPPRQVSEGGGSEPVWGRDATSIYYLNADTVMRAAFTNGLVGPRTPLFATDRLTENFSGVPVITNWDVHPDGDRFVFVRNATERSSSETPRIPVEVIVNWFSELDRLVPR